MERRYLSPSMQQRFQQLYRSMGGDEFESAIRASLLDAGLID